MQQAMQQAMQQVDSPDDFAGTDPNEVLMTRRRILLAAGALGTFGAGRAAWPSPAAAAASSCVAIPPETAGPFPGDGSNGPNLLTTKGVVRRDITRSFGQSTTAAAGVPLSVTFQLRSAKKGCRPLGGAAVYAWHCDRDGNYSMYTTGVEDENFLRGVQVSDKSGNVTFRTIFPGHYPGRWPHIHFEVFASASKATTSRNAIATSQLAFPKSACADAYLAPGYEASFALLSEWDLTDDNIFGDNPTAQTAQTTGSLQKGFVSKLVVNV
jgi:protocatechuate 3,4-dioxygenase beta subunit